MKILLLLRKDGTVLADFSGHHPVLESNGTPEYHLLPKVNKCKRMNYAHILTQESKDRIFH